MKACNDPVTTTATYPDHKVVDCIVPGEFWAQILVSQKIPPPILRLKVLTVTWCRSLVRAPLVEFSLPQGGRAPQFEKHCLNALGGTRFPWEFRQYY
ncbi:hypothetical protein TNCV_2692281 [Trichonephila clavipes]|uniref:Uncharacterized protein n=1 Tax=Trichonephila clavipes TaxID=2585209 RepID=A0A8X7BBZ4_TRICX|nr:hypothetical protein TNCV_2692281 [Trichonephila clavipes]